MIEEKRNRRDLSLNNRMRMYNNAPQCDIDLLLYNGQLEPVAIFEKKHGNSYFLYINDTEMTVLKNFANNWQVPLPLWKLAYYFVKTNGLLLQDYENVNLPLEHIQFYIIPANQAAYNIQPEGWLTEEEFHKLITRLTGINKSSGEKLYNTLYDPKDNGWDIRVIGRLFPLPGSITSVPFLKVV